MRERQGPLLRCLSFVLFPFGSQAKGLLIAQVPSCYVAFSALFTLY